MSLLLSFRCFCIFFFFDISAFLKFRLSRFVCCVFPYRHIFFLPFLPLLRSCLFSLLLFPSFFSFFLFSPSLKQHIRDQIISLFSFQLPFVPLIYFLLPFHPTRFLFPSPFSHNLRICPSIVPLTAPLLFLLLTLAYSSHSPLPSPTHLLLIVITFSSYPPLPLDPFPQPITRLPS